MDARPIGVFDSGLGGLTAVKKLAQLLPGEDIIYLGDTGRVPYGSRSPETIIKYARQDAEFLSGFDIKAMMVACNTVSSSALGVLMNSCTMPVYGVVEDPVLTAVSTTKNGKIGVIGTEATIRSGAYVTSLSKAAPEIEVFCAACPLFVPLVENGRTGEADIVALTVAGEYLAPLITAGVDTLIMGCTHYPLLQGVISKIMGANVTLVDSGAETAKRVARDLANNGMMAEGNATGTLKYFVTDGIDGFSKLASRFLEADIGGMVEQISLE